MLIRSLVLCQEPLSPALIDWAPKKKNRIFSCPPTLLHGECHGSSSCIYKTCASQHTQVSSIMLLQQLASSSSILLTTQLRAPGAARSTTHSCRETGSPPPASSGQRSSMAAARGQHPCTLRRCPEWLPRLPPPRLRISHRWCPRAGAPQLGCSAAKMGR